ncbi:MAG: abortive infection family protein [Mycobacteriales bacterium]
MAAPPLVSADDLLLFLDSFRTDPAREHQLRLGLDMVREACDHGLAIWGQHSMIAHRMGELKSDGFVDYTLPPFATTQTGIGLTDSDLSNLRDINLTAAGRQEARGLREERSRSVAATLAPTDASVAVLEQRSGMTPAEIAGLVNRYIGVNEGYLGDFSYSTHRAFYPQYCDLDIDPDQYDGTTRQRFMTILSGLSASDQAKVVRGALERFPVGGPRSPSTRTHQARAELADLANRLVSGSPPAVPDQALSHASDLVRGALREAETLIGTTGAATAIDRVHTAMHGYLIGQCDAVGIERLGDDSMPKLLRRLRAEHPGLFDLGPRPEETARVLNACGSILDAMHPMRNMASRAHPNAHLLDDNEARFVINVAKSMLYYLDVKVGSAPQSGLPPTQSG